MIYCPASHDAMPCNGETSVLSTKGGLRKRKCLKCNVHFITSEEFGEFIPPPKTKAKAHAAPIVDGNFTIYHRGVK